MRWLVPFGARLPVWQLALIGGFLVVAGAVVFEQLSFVVLGTRIRFVFQLLGLAVMASGFAHFWAVFAIPKERSPEQIAADVALREASLANQVPIARAATEPSLAALPPAPRLGDDPFRDPPRRAIVPVRHERPAGPIPRVPAARAMPEASGTAENPDERPKFLK